MSPTTAPEIFQQLAEGLSRVNKGGFFHHLAHTLAHLLSADHALVASIDRSGTATPLAMWSEGEFVDAAPYTLSGTPCERVKERTCFHITSQARACFPDDARLAALSVESYLGVPMSDASGHCHGILVLMHSRPLQLPNYANEVMRIIASLAGVELSRQLVGQQADQQIACKQRALRLLSRGNDARFHASDETSLLQSACRVLVDVGGYTAAWVHHIVPGMENPEGVLQACADREADVLGWLSPKQLLVAGYSRDIIRQAISRRAPVVYRPQCDPNASGSDTTLVALEVAVLVALPLIYRGQLLGVITLYQSDDAPMTAAEVRLLSELADDIAFGIDSLRHRKAEQRIQHAVTQVATAVSAQHGEAFLTQLTDHMANALAADVGFIATLDEQDPNIANVLALYVNGVRQSAFSYHLAGVPCQDVLTQRECIVHENAGIRLPVESNGALAWVNAYVGRRLDDAKGRPIGIIGVMFKAPLFETQIVSTVLQIFAARAASELGRQRDEARIRQLAFRDAGTQLPNRTDFMQCLEECVNDHPPTPFALLLLDLNHFKEINDTAGHDVGDLVLKEVAQRFRSVLPADDYLARLGGDEFVVICRGVHDDVSAMQTADILCASLHQPMVIEQHSSELSVSVGISLYPDHGQSAQALLKHADIAMYQAKRQKLTMRTFEHWMGHAVAQQLHIAKRLAMAIAHQSLYLHFQPQVDMRSGQLIGAEALCRWWDEELGEVSPVQFIAIAEERGMIAALGNCVIDQACRQLADWQRQGVELRGQLAINIAADQFEDSDLVTTLLASCQAHGISPQALSIEITESGIMTHPDDAIAITEVLKSHGMGLSIDDFGTGYSSLAYLKRFAADKIKIDISFVRDMLTSENDRAIVRTIIAMANALGLQTIAEGIESKEQCEALIAMGCTQAQGYFYDRPLTADHFANKWLV
ncbi:MAG TPA: histidine kinase [Halomonas sp.]|nr:histidine kinase [Halomonas sp.]